MWQLLGAIVAARGLFHCVHSIVDRARPKCHGKRCSLQLVRCDLLLKRCWNCGISYQYIVPFECGFVAISRFYCDSEHASCAVQRCGEIPAFLCVLGWRLSVLLCSAAIPSSDFVFEFRWRVSRRSGIASSLRHSFASQRDGKRRSDDCRKHESRHSRDDSHWFLIRSFIRFPFVFSLAFSIHFLYWAGFTTTYAGKGTPFYGFLDGASDVALFYTPVTFAIVPATKDVVVVDRCMLHFPLSFFYARYDSLFHCLFSCRYLFAFIGVFQFPSQSLSEENQCRDSSC